MQNDTSTIGPYKYLPYPKRWTFMPIPTKTRCKCATCKKSFDSIDEYCNHPCSGDGDDEIK